MAAFFFFVFFFILVLYSVFFYKLYSLIVVLVRFTLLQMVFIFTVQFYLGGPKNMDRWKEDTAKDDHLERQTSIPYLPLTLHTEMPRD